MSRFSILFILFLICNKDGVNSNNVNKKNGFSESLKVSEVRFNAAKTQTEENKNDIVTKNTDLYETANINVSCGIRLVPESRIVGGNQSSPGRWPWQALLFHDSRSAICGGVLINERWILTAAHCFDSDSNPRNHFVRLGAFNYTECEDTAVDYGMTKIIIHNEYNPTTITNDIALIELTTDVEFSNYIIPACLPDQDEDDPLQEECWTSGWGETGNSSEPMSILREAEFPIIEYSNCSDILNEVNISINEKHICAGYLNPGTGICLGDSVGPLVCRNSSSSFALQGITSFVVGGCASKYPDVFTRVSSFIEWIETNTRNSNDDAFYKIPEQQCDSIVTTDGVFRLPTNTTTGLYRPNMNCIWTLIPDYNFNSRIEISVVEKMSIQAPENETCFDYVEVQVFPETSTPRLVFCGFRFPDINPLSVDVNPDTTINITFHSNGEKNYQGFALEVKFVEITTVTCGERLIPDSRIVGGNQSSPGRWPWQALLTYNSSYMCGGTLINDRWVLTAAQCFANSITTERYKVWLGEFNYLEDESTEFNYSISQIRIHHEYDSTTFENDIALIELTSTVQFTNYIVPACLPDDCEIVPEGERCWISGWGNTENSIQPANISREAEIPILANSVCENAYDDGFNGIEQLCAGYLQQEIGICNGDAGAPLVCEDSSSFVLQGIASFLNASDCAAREIPDRYTRVSNYICWIDATMNDEDVAKCSGNKIQSHFYVAFLMFTLIVQLFWLNV